MIRNMLNNNKNDFPLELKKKFYKIRMRVNPILNLKKGEKLGKNDKGEYEIFTNGYFQQTVRWWYSQNRGKTVGYLDEDFTNYMKFLDELCYYLSKDVLGVYANFSEQVKEYNRDMIRALYVLKETYRCCVGDAKDIIAKIDSIILTLIDFKDKVENYKINNKKRYISFENMSGPNYHSD